MMKRYGYFYYAITSFILLLFVSICFTGLSAQAQVLPERESKNSDRPIGVRLPFDQREVASAHSSPSTASAPFADDALEHIDSQVVINRTLNPRPEINFDVTGPGQYAGDVNGDGVDDYIHTRLARDERTSDILEDRTEKTALFFGKDLPIQKEDQLVYNALHPVGDLNGDKYDDAIARTDGHIHTFLGSPNGYVKDETSVLNGFEYDGLPKGFTDLNGDGYEDAVVQSFDARSFAVLLGGSAPNDFQSCTYSLSDLTESYHIGVSDLDGDGLSEIVSFERRRTSSYISSYEYQISILEVTDCSEPSVKFVFKPKALNPNYNAILYDISVADVNGDQLPDILLNRRDETFVYESTSAEGSAYDSDPVVHSVKVLPTGDLDGDGRQDFAVALSRDDNGVYEWNIAFGSYPSNSTLGLSSVEDGVNPSPYVWGDFDGNGVDDLLFSGVEDNPGGKGLLKRHFLSLGTDQSVQLKSVAYEEGRFLDIIIAANNIGDINGDGYEDFTLSRNYRDQVDVFFGNQPFSDTPDLVLKNGNAGEGPYNVIGGDVNGDGKRDIVVSFCDSGEFAFYLGGAIDENKPDYIITSEDITGGHDYRNLCQIENIGDVNDDGADDLAIGLPLDKASTEPLVYRNNVYLIFGGSSPPSAASVVIDYEDGPYLGAGWEITGLGDVNEDGTDDFAVGVNRFIHDEPASAYENGKVDVFFGSATSTFNSPSLSLRTDPKTLVSYARPDFSSGLDGRGDFNGDGVNDIAVMSVSFQDGLAVEVFHGGSDMDTQADQFLTTSIGVYNGNVHFVPDVDSDGDDELLLTSGMAGSNIAPLYMGGTEVENWPNVAMAGPNSDAYLGGIFGVAIGDFNADGTTDYVAVQMIDNNDAAYSSRSYVYSYGSYPFQQGPPVAPVDVAPVDGGISEATLAWSPARGAAEYVIYRGTTPMPTASYATVGADATEFVDTEAAPDRTYYYRLKTVGTNGLESDFSEQVIVYARTMPTTASRTFADATKNQNYRLVALPGDVSLPVGGTFSGTAGTDWRAFYDTGADTDYLAEYDGTTRFTFTPGTGFWVLAKNGWQGTGDADAVDAETQATGTYAIDLHAGWNVISNPLAVDVDWAAVQAANGTAQALWRFTGSFAEVSTFASARDGEAFYFFNGDGLGELVLPYPGAEVTTTMAADKALASLDGTRTLTLSVMAGDEQASAVRVSLVDEAPADLDRYNLVAPPGRFEAASLRLIDTEPVHAASRRALLAHAYRPAGDHGQAFPVQLAAAPGQPVVLRADGLEAFEGQSVVLVEEGTGRTYDLRAEPATTITPAHNEVRMQLLVGTAAFVAQAQAQARIDDLDLSPGYPNPLTRSTTLVYALPEAGPVRLVIYDILGRRVRTLVDESQRAGEHRATWDGRSQHGQPVGSGMYFARIEAGGSVRVQKLVVVR